MPYHVVVDGSNLATEGRSLPSLSQLNEAVLAFIAEHPEALITVVADATFGHRIDKRELADFDAAVANNEIVCPPAGAVGRGDAFVLSIANKVGATILSNDSYQEFHGTYTWLFDEGRLIGGKPVPHVGWVFVTRTPVRGVTSRKAVADAKRKPGKATGAPVRAGRPSAEASQPMPTPKSPPPGKAPRPAKAAAAAKAPAPAPAAPAAEPAHKQSSVQAHVNDLLSFLSFVEQHPVGSTVSATVEHYSSHGAYVRVDDVVAYVPLRLMADPPPRSARELLKVGEQVDLIVESFAPGRRSIDLAVAAMSSAPPPPAAKPSRSKKRAAAPVAADPPPAEAKKPTRTRKQAAEPAASVASAGPAAPRSRSPRKPLPDPQPGAPATPAATPAKAPAKVPAKAPAKAPARTPAQRAAASPKAASAQPPATSPATSPGTSTATPVPAKKASRSRRPETSSAAAVPAAAAASGADASTPSPRRRAKKADAATAVPAVAGAHSTPPAAPPRRRAAAKAEPAPTPPADPPATTRAPRKRTAPR